MHVAKPLRLTQRVDVPFSSCLSRLTQYFDGLFANPKIITSDEILKPRFQPLKWLPLLTA